MEIARRSGLTSHKLACEESLLEFIRHFWHIVEPTTKLVEGWPLLLICDILTSVTDGHSTLDIINVPPGFMKSYCLNVFWPAWEWGPQNRASLRYLAASYSGELANRDNGGDVGRFARLILCMEYRLLWGDRFHVVKNNAGLVENNKTGSKRVVTMSGGATTGFRGDRILIDDANNPLDVESETVRATTITWLREVMPSRVNNSQSAIINIQQRTHEEDATGTLVKFEGWAWRWTMVPMEFDPMRTTPVVLQFDEEGRPLTTWEDPRGLDENGKRLEGLFHDARGKLQLRPGSPMAKAEGLLAWPERFDRKYADQRRNILGPYAYEGQFQQSPGVRGGGIIRRDWWQPWDKELNPELGTVIAALDTAIEEGDKNDWNALVTFGAFAGEEGEPKLILTSAGKWRVQLAELVTRVAEVCTYRKVDYLLIERRTRGKDVHDEIVRLFANAKWQTILVDVTATKIARLKAVSHLFSGDLKRDAVSGIDMYSGGCIYAPPKEWADEVVDQVASFPMAAHDDYVDCVSMALGWVRKNGVVVRKVEYEDERDNAMRYRPRVGVPYAIRRS